MCGVGGNAMRNRGNASNRNEPPATANRGGASSWGERRGPQRGGARGGRAGGTRGSGSNPYALAPMRGTVRTATQTLTSTSNPTSTPIPQSPSVARSTFISPSPRINTAAPPAISGRMLRSTSTTTPNPISSPVFPTPSVPPATNISPSSSIAIAAPPAILGKTFTPDVPTDLGRHKITGEPNAFGDLPDYPKHLKGFTKKALTKCKEVVFDGTNGRKSVSHFDLDRSKVEKRDATQIDELAESMTRLERGSYRLRSAEGLDLVWIFEGLLSFNDVDFPKMPESLREGIRNQVPDALRYLTGVDSYDQDGKPHYRVNLGSPLDARHQVERENKGLNGACQGLGHFGQWVDPYGKTFGKTKDTRQDGKNKAQTHVGAFYAALAPACHLINTMFARIAPDWYAYYEPIYKMASERPGVKDLLNSDRQVWCTMAIIHNHQVDPHKDSKDIAYGFVAMTCAGNFTKGDLVLPDLGVSIPYQPGDVVFMRSAILEHFISTYNGLRTSLVWFTHADVLEKLLVEQEMNAGVKTELHKDFAATCAAVPPRHRRRR